jgi:penicillin-binding protein 1A
MHVAPVFVTSIERADGTVLFETEHRQRRAVRPDVADRVTGVLEQAVARGTGTAAQLPGRPVAGKTGTAQAWRNAWFCGYVPQLATAVWVGFPGTVQYSMVPPRTPIRVTGGSYPAQIWQRFMAAALEGVPALPFPAPTTTTSTTSPYGALPPTPTTGVQQVLPDVVGRPATDAAALLRALGYRVATVEGDRGSAPGTVTAMAPRAGTAVGVGGRVTLEIAPGPSAVRVPDVVGRTQDEAVAILVAAGLQATVVAEERPQGGTQPGRVWRQEPSAGASVAAGTNVRLAVEPRPTPS